MATTKTPQQFAGDAERRGMRRILDVLEEFRSVYSEMPAQQQAVFLYVAAREAEGGDPPTMLELCKTMGFSQSSASRNVAALSQWHRLGKPGLDLMVAAEDPAERRRKILKLTPKGRRLADRLNRALWRAEED